MNVQCPSEGAQQRGAVVNPVPTQVLRFNAVCRVCGNEDENSIDIFSNEGLTQELALKMNTYLPVKVADGDSLPSSCCWNCVSLIVSWHELVAVSVETDRKLKELLVVDAKPRAVSPKVEIESVMVVSHMDTAVVKEEDAGFVDFRDAIIKREDEDSIGSTSSVGTRVEVLEGNEGQKFEQQPICDMCGKSFSSNSTLSRHKRTFHKGIVVVDEKLLYECDICKKRYGDRYGFAAHCQTHVKPSHTCDICGKQYTTTRSLQRHHKQNHTTKRFTCKICGAQFGARFWLAQHLNTHSDTRPYACDVCGKAFRQASTLYMHKRCHKDFQFSCDTCGKGFRRRWYLNRHIEWHTNGGTYNCDLCGKTFRLHKTLQQHMKDHDPLAVDSRDAEPAEMFERSQEKS